MTHHAEDGWFRNFSKEPNRFRLGHNFLGLNFGLIDFNWEASPQTVTLQIRGTGNAIKLEEVVTLVPRDSGFTSRFSRRQTTVATSVPKIAPAMTSET